VLVVQGYFLAAALTSVGAAVGRPVMWQIALGRSMAKFSRSSAIHLTMFPAGAAGGPAGERPFLLIPTPALPWRTSR
jgi:hypothetical protein